MRTLPIAALVAIAALILAVTLWPDPAAAEFQALSCLFCGERATADAIANVILFTPLGAAIAWAIPGMRRAWRVGLALSLAIELAQRFIAGRDASVGDVITNTLGTILGLTLWRYVTGGARRPAPAAWPLAALGFAAAVGVTVWLLQPALTDAPYYGQWTPPAKQLEWYRGRVNRATLDSAPLPPGELTDPIPVSTFVRGHGSLALQFIAGRRTPALASLVSVVDGENWEIMLLGPDRDALVLRYRRRAAAWRLDEPDLRFEGATRGWEIGDTLAITVDRTLRGACLTAGGTPACLPSTTPGRAWSLVYPESFPAWSRAALDVLWVGGLALLLGWCAGTPGAAGGAGLVAVATLIALPPLIGGVAAPLAELAGACGGLVAGAWLRLVARRRA